jgi:hypothetical protein
MFKEKVFQLFRNPGEGIHTQESRFGFEKIGLFTINGII